MLSYRTPLPIVTEGDAENGSIPDEPIGWRELVEMGAIEPKSSQAREFIARWLLTQVEAGENDPGKLKALVIDRFSKRS